MIRLIVFSAFALAVATSAKAMSPAPLHQPDGMITQVICGPGQVRSQTGNCVWKSRQPQPPYQVRRWLPQVCGMERRLLRSVPLRRH